MIFFFVTNLCGYILKKIFFHEFHQMKTGIYSVAVRFINETRVVLIFSG